MNVRQAPAVGFAAFSGTGKTTLIAALLRRFQAMGVRVGAIKHTHHDVEPDQPGKDSHVLRHAGATQVLLASPRRWALMTEVPEPDGDVLAFHLAHLDHANLDLVLVEGFRFGALPRIELHRPSLGRPLLFPGDPGIIALATDAPPAIAPDLPVLDLNDSDAIARFIVDRFLPARQTGA